MTMLYAVLCTEEIRHERLFYAPIYYGSDVGILMGMQGSGKHTGCSGILNAAIWNILRSSDQFMIDL